MDNDAFPSHEALSRRLRASAVVLASGVLASAWFLMLDFGAPSFVQTDDPWFFLAAATVPYAAAGLATWLCRRSWDATSWLFGTWVVMTVGGALFLLRYTILETRSGFLSELVYLGPPLLQTPVVLFAALVALVLYRRDPARY